MARFYRRRKFCRFTAENVAYIDYKDIDTLKKHFAKEFEQYGANIKSKTDTVEYGLFYNATYKNNVSAQIFWLKCHRPEIYSEKVQNNKDVSSDDILKYIADNLPE